MIDIHCHMLPNVDDGSDSYETSIKLLKEAEKEGITDVILTPHYMPHTDAVVKSYELARKFEEFKQVMQDNNINIRFYMGNELYIDKTLDTLLINSEINSLNDLNYVLVEFPFGKYKDEFDEYLYNIAVHGFIVIIAHPERYRYVQNDIDFVDRWVDEGYLLQGNATSLLRNDEKKILFKLIKQGKLSFIASDAHSEHRPVSLINAYKLIEKKFGRQIAYRLFIRNPNAVINNYVVKPMPKG